MADQGSGSNGRGSGSRGSGSGTTRVGMSAMLSDLRQAIETERGKTTSRQSQPSADRIGSAPSRRTGGSAVHIQGRQPTLHGFRTAQGRSGDKIVGRGGHKGEMMGDAGLIAGGNARWQCNGVPLGRSSARSADMAAPGSPRVLSSARPGPVVSIAPQTRSPKGSPRLSSATNRPRPPPSAHQKPSDPVRESLSGGSMRAVYTLPPDFPHDRMRVTTSPILPGVPVVIRSANERTVHPERLSLDGFKFERCPILEHEYSLRLLNLQHSRISKIEHMTNLRNLIFLDLYDNLVSDVSGLEGVPSLRVLMLGANRLTEISTAFWHVSNLDVLDVHANQLSSIRNIDRLSNLRVLNLSYNMLTSVEGLGSLHVLAELNLRGNRITTVASGLDALRRLERLNLGDNLIETNADLRAISHLVSMQELNLVGNQCTSGNQYREKWVGDFRALKILDGKKVGDEERRIAHINLRKRAEKHKEATRHAMLKTQREAAINAVRTEWEASKMAAQRTEPQAFYELDKSTLVLYGPAFDAFDKTYPDTIVGLRVMYCPFDEFAAHVHKIRQRLPGVVRLEIDATNMASFKHINALGALRRMETISIGENEPLVRTVTLWRRFLLYRLAHLPLKKINGVEVTPEELAESKVAFSALDRLIDASAAIARPSPPTLQEVPADSDRRRKDGVPRRYSTETSFLAQSAVGGSSIGGVATKKEASRKTPRDLRPLTPRSATRISESFVAQQAAAATARHVWSIAIDAAWEGVVEKYVESVVSADS